MSVLQPILSMLPESKNHFVFWEKIVQQIALNKIGIKEEKEKDKKDLKTNKQEMFGSHVPRCPSASTKRQIKNRKGGTWGEENPLINISRNHPESNSKSGKLNLRDCVARNSKKNLVASIWSPFVRS